MGRAWSPALTCVEDTAKRCDLASPRVGRVRSCREHRATNQLMTRAVTCKCLEKEEGRFSTGPRLLISGSTVRVRDGPPIVTGTSRTPEVPVAVFATTFVVEAIHRGFVAHRQPLPVRVDGQLDRGVAELSLHIGRRVALLEQQAHERVAWSAASRRRASAGAGGESD